MIKFYFCFIFHAMSVFIVLVNQNVGNLSGNTRGVCHPIFLRASDCFRNDFFRDNSCSTQFLCAVASKSLIALFPALSVGLFIPCCRRVCNCWRLRTTGSLVAASGKVKTLNKMWRLWGRNAGSTMENLSIVRAGSKQQRQHKLPSFIRNTKNIQTSGLCDYERIAVVGSPRPWSMLLLQLICLLHDGFI